jgi:hypothetical protein
MGIDIKSFYEQGKKKNQTDDSYIITSSSVGEIEVSYKIVNGKRTKEIIETGTTYQERKLNPEN